MRHLVRAAALFASIAALPALAADLDLPGYSLPTGRPTSGFARGWYLRGDIGYSMPIDARLQVLRTALGTVEDYTGDRLGKQGTIGAGVGYHLMPWLRVDATVEQRFKSSVIGAYSSIGDPALQREDTRADFSALSGLVNIYADLGSWSGITPYVGAGVGVAQTKFGNYSGIYTITALAPGWGTGACPPAAPGLNETCASPSTPGAVKKTGLAYALMAGASIDVSPFVKIDVGYRFMHYGTATMTPDPAGISIRLKDVNTHEVRLGLRYMLGGKLFPTALTAKN